MTVFTPGPQGGTNWQPSSYNPNTHMFYVCAQSGVTGNTATTEQPATKQGDVAQVALGGTLTIAGGFGENMGTFSADRRDDGQDRLAEEVARVVLRRLDDDEAATSSSSAATTAELQAYNATNGDPLWSFQTGAGANNAPTIFEQNGKRVRRVLRRRQRARRFAARRQPLALLARRHSSAPRRPARAPASSMRRHRRRRRQDRRRRRRQRRPRRPARSSSPTTASTLPRRTGHGGNGGPDLTTRPEREETATRRQAGDERRRRHAGLQGPADEAADRGRRGLRHAEDREVARRPHASAPQSAAPIAPACGPSSAAAIAIRSSGATRARFCDRAAQRPEQQVARLHDAATDHDPLRAEEDQHVRDRQADQVARALERRPSRERRLRAPARRPRRMCPSRPRRRSPARRRRARGSRGYRTRRGARPPAPCGDRTRRRAARGPRCKRPPSTSPPPIPVPQTMHITSSAPRPDPRRDSASANACPSLIRCTSCPSACGERPADRAAAPVAEQIGEEKRVPVAVEEPRQRDADRVDLARGASELDHALEDALRAAARASVSVLRRAPAGGCRRAARA